MAIRPKTRKRLFILISVGLVLVLLLGGAYGTRKLILRQRILNNRVEGLALIQKGEYREGLHTLGNYVWRYPKDVEALYQYAYARQRLEEPNGRHLVEALGVLRRVVELDPLHPTARTELLELYSRVGYNTEALQLAEQLLADDPLHALALRTKALAMMRMRRYAEALDASEKYNQVAPADLDGQFLTFAILRQTNTAPAKLLARAKKIVQAHPDQPGLLLLLALSHQLNNQNQEALKVYRSVAAHPKPDEDLIKRLVGMLDAWGQYAESLAVLEKHAGSQSDPKLRLLYARRLLETDRLADLLQFTQPDPASPTPADMLVLRGLTLLRQGNLDDLRSLVEQLSKQADSPVAHWLPVFQLSLESKPPTPQDRLQTIRTALEKDATNPFFRVFLAEAYLAQGESALALQALSQAAQNAPAWYMPLLRAAEINASSDRITQAQELAAAALQRAPTNFVVALTLGEIRLAAIPDQDKKSLGELLQLVDQLQTAAPNQPRVQYLRCAVLARLNDAPAFRQAVQALLTAHPDLESSLLLRLAALSQQYGMGVEEPLLAQAGKSPTSGPELVMFQAVQLAQQNKLEDGRKLLTQALKKAPTDSIVTWHLTLARYLDRFFPEDAPQNWDELCQRFPEDAQVHRLALESQSLWRDRDRTQSVIDRLQKIVGPDAPSWRIHQARWILTGAPAPKEQAQAVTLLHEYLRATPEDPQARMMLAMAMELSNNIPAALEQLETAASLRPQAANIALQQARLHHRQGDAARATAALDRLENLSLSSDEMRQAVSLWSDLGQPVKALRMLENPALAQQPGFDPLRAMLYQQTGQPQQTQAVIQRMLQNPTPANIELAAEFYAMHDRMPQALEILAKLDTQTLPPGQLELIRGRFALRHQSPQIAQPLLEKAAKLTPDDPRLWESLFDLHLALGDPQALQATVKAASKALPEHPGYKVLVQQPQLLGVLRTFPPARPMLRSLFANDAHREPALQVLTLLQQASDNSQTYAQLLDQLRPLAQQNPRFLELNLLQIRLMLMAERAEEALTQASQLMQAHPQAAQPAELASVAAAAAGRWSEALAAAKAWRQRDPGQAQRADLAIAESHLNLKNPRAALTQLQPLLPAAQADPNSAPQVLLMQARALLASNQSAHAASLLRPLLANNPNWQQAWLRLATISAPDRATAVAWLKEIQPLLPATDADAQLTLAQAWYAIHQRFQQADDLSQATNRFRALSARSDLTADQHLAAALFFDTTRDLPAAENAYRQALAKEPQPVAQNNLAMLLIHQGRAADALPLAQQAVKATESRSQPFLDTLGQAQLALGQTEPAIATFQQALGLAPQNPEALLHLAKAYLAIGDKPKADLLLNQLKTYHPDPRTLSPDLQQTLSELQKKLL